MSEWVHGYIRIESRNKGSVRGNKSESARRGGSSSQLRNLLRVESAGISHQRSNGRQTSGIPV